MRLRSRLLLPAVLLATVLGGCLPAGDGPGGSRVEPREISMRDDDADDAPAPAEAAEQDEPETRDAAAEEAPDGAAEAVEVDAFDVRVGDCVHTPDLEDLVETVRTVPCSEPHDSEAFASMDLPDGEYPGIDAVELAADDFCYAEFPGFVGMSYEDSELYYFPLYPVEDGWNVLDDREVLCFVTDEAGGVTGTLADARR